MSNPEPSENKNFPIWKLILIAFIIVIVLWSLNFLILINKTERGILGDMFGVVNSLFSGLAFAGIIITIYLQRDELRLQRKELEETRNEFITQNITLRLQRFENTFFSMLSLHHQIVNNIDWSIRKQIDDGRRGLRLSTEKIETESISYNGRDVFELHYSELRKQLRQIFSQADINDNYKIEYSKYQNDFDHYFRNLYRIIKLIDTTQFTANDKPEEEFAEKYKYTSIVRAQLSAYELLWLFYNCLSENGIEKFKPLIEKYTLFKSFRTSELAEKSHKELYKLSAFEKQKS